MMFSVLLTVLLQPENALTETSRNAAAANVRIKVFINHPSFLAGDSVLTMESVYFPDGRSARRVPTPGRAVSG